MAQRTKALAVHAYQSVLSPRNPHEGERRKETPHTCCDLHRNIGASPTPHPTHHTYILWAEEGGSIVSAYCSCR